MGGRIRHGRKGAKTGSRTEMGRAEGGVACLRSRRGARTRPPPMNHAMSKRIGGVYHARMAEVVAETGERVRINKCHYK